ncbi:sulfite reductase subunit alpha [Paucibacter sp. R3-3]|uniref:NADPH--hemoprotein reductase n=1 Tax=Roseateles agri TaxID=3098619 RepID=A0ABU5DDX9_9BURK|nr:sulfite reductase subunit alpha [Paucibacter sp. R3-3]MDY0744487.1 sulfite reductase subunit alpha [Paucibacter sp. R3-3]
MSREAWALLIVLAYAALCVAVGLRERGRRRRLQAELAALLPAADDAPAVLVLHASQTGSAEEIARSTARALHLAGLPVRLMALSEVREVDLQAAGHALFLASTYGEGDAPDSGAVFARDLMTREDLDLSGLQFGLLALGDATYAQFCGFGRQLDAWLHARGAQPMFDRIEVDRDDARALERWRQSLSHLAGTVDASAFEAAAFSPWRLLERRLLNPGSEGGAVFHLELVPADGTALPDWEAGDLVQLGLGEVHAGEAPREYTIASLPSDGRVHLMVRQSHRDDGSLGLASGLLTEGLAVGDSVPLRLREHRGFRIGANAGRPLVLIGNGSGLAGLRAHLKAHALRTGARAWLLYGERRAAHDAHYDGEITAWQHSGLLERVDRVYSRDVVTRRYVQHALAASIEVLIEWLDRGAAIYVCGSLQGMAAGVDSVLRERLGDARVDALIADGRLRRDVY